MISCLRIDFISTNQLELTFCSGWRHKLMQNYSSHPHAPAFQREQEAAELIDVRPVLVRWRVIAVLALVLFVGANALLGTVLFQVVGAVSITVYGLVVLARKIVQITFARMSNYRTRRIV